MDVDVLGRRRTRRVYLTTLQIARAVALIESGRSRREVARLMNVSHSAISRAWNRHIVHGIVPRAPYPPRPRATSAREDRILRNWATRNRTLTARALQNQLVAATGTQISDQTVRNRLHEGQFRARRPARCPRLTPAHKRARLFFARQHRDWTIEQWSRVMFSDESRFCLFHNDGRARVWRRPGERYLESTVHSVVPFGGGSIMIWAGITLRARTGLVIVRGRSLTAERYRDEILAPHVVPFAENLQRNFVFQQDNARPHIARVVTNYLHDHNIQVMDWPANSPDLNPIEHLWDELGRSLQQHQPLRNLNDVEQILLQKWENLPQEIITNLVESMPRRCAEVIRVRGAHTHY